MIICFGGGKGLSATVKALQMKGKDFAAVVCTVDNGGSTGRLRKEFGIPAIGDFRRVVDTLSKNPLAKIMESRHDGHALGNLVILNLIKEHGFGKGLEEYRRMLQVEEKIIPHFLTSCDLQAKIFGKWITGEVQIDESSGRVEDLGLTGDCEPNPEVLELLKNAESVILGPGSLYTSILPHLINEEIKNAILKVPKRVMVTGLLNDVKLLSDFQLSHHIKEVEKFIKLTHILAQKPPSGVLVDINESRILIEDMFLIEGYHDPKKLGEVLCKIL